MSKFFFRTALVSVSVLAAVSVIAPAAFADDRQPEQVALSTQGVNFSDQAQARAFYAKLRNVANAVCDSDTAPRNHAAVEYKTCVQDSVSDAVRDLNQPLLSQVYEEQAGYSQLAMASRKSR